MEILIKTAPMIVVAKKLDPFVKKIAFNNPQTNRLTVQAEQIAYRISVENILKCALPKTLSGGLHEIRNPVVGSGSPPLKNYRPDSLEDSKLEQFILFMDGGGNLIAPNSWESMDRESEIQKLL